MNLIIVIIIIVAIMVLFEVIEDRNKNKYSKETQKHVLNALKLDTELTDYARGWNEALDRLSELVDKL